MNNLMEHMSAITAKTKASSLIRLIKNHGKILKLLSNRKILAHKTRFFKFRKKARHRIHYIFDNEAKKLDAIIS